jgi:hypothetical protein
MTKYVEFPLEDGGTILIETPDEPARPGSGFVRGSAGDLTSEWASKAQKSFDQSLLGVRTSAEKLVQHLSALGPDEMEVNFSLKATGELGGNLAIAKTGAEANYNVSLRWRKEKVHEEAGKKKEEDKKKEEAPTEPETGAE